MDIERSTPGAEPSLQQVLTKKVLHDAALQIGIIDANSRQIAECAALSARIQAAGMGFYSSPVVTVLTNSVYARVMISYRSLSSVRDAISRAGLHIHSEETLVTKQSIDFPEEPEIRLELVGYDCIVLITKIAEESIIDYAEAA